LWLTGLSGSGKSTLAGEVRRRLGTAAIPAVLLDGDRLRAGLCRDLGFSPADRAEHVHRVASLARLLADDDVLPIVALISPFRSDREHARRVVGPDLFLEVFVDCPTAVCEHRDPKGLYRKARAGQVTAFPGIDAPYEPPLRPALHLRTDTRSIDDCVAALWTLLEGALGPVTAASAAGPWS
jgi:adenylyl-sulfate kinase